MDASHHSNQQSRQQLALVWLSHLMQDIYRAGHETHILQAAGAPARADGGYPASDTTTHDEHEGRVRPPVAAWPVIISYELPTAVLELSTDPTIRSLQPANIAPPCCKAISQAHEALRQLGRRSLDVERGRERKNTSLFVEASRRHSQSCRLQGLYEDHR